MGTTGHSFLNCRCIIYLAGDSGYVTRNFGRQLGSVADKECEAVTVTQGSETEVDTGRTYILSVQVNGR